MPTETPRSLRSGAPHRRVLWLLALGVLLAHAAVLLGTGPLLLSPASGPARPGPPLQTRLLPGEAQTPAPPPAARAKPSEHSARLMDASQAKATVNLEGSTSVNDAGSATAAASAASEPAAAEPTPTARAEASAPASLVVQASTPQAPAPATESASAPPAVPAAEAVSSAQTLPGPLTAGTTEPLPLAAAGAEGVPLQVSPADLPPPVLLSYDMTGMDKGLRYTASGELQWQHDGRRYALTLSVRAFLVGSRHWRSRGSIGPAGLEPARFSDTRRSELAAHFDRTGQRVVFSNNAPAAPLQTGAQDQISLYVQLAAAMAGQPDAFATGRRVQLQTATVRDAAPWQLTLEEREVVQVNGQPVTTAKWVCLPRQRFDSRIEFWASPQHHGLPARIRITQTSGSYIDMQLRSMQSLPPLPPDSGLGEKTTPP